MGPEDYVAGPKTAETKEYKDDKAYLRIFKSKDLIFKLK